MKKIYWITIVLLAGFPLVAIFYGVFNMGSIAMLMIACFAAAYPLLWKKSAGKRLWRFVLFVFPALGGLVAAVLSGWMLVQGYFTPPPAGGTCTVVVLGAKAIGTQPSLMLRYRLESALLYLEQNPQATCIVSGGQGADEQLPEATVMANWLIAKGIDPSRVIQEPLSTNTEQNIRFSLALLPKGSSGIVVVTDGFHQLRASLHAAKHGYATYSIPSKTPPGLLPVYWVREVGGLAVQAVQTIINK